MATLTSNAPVRLTEDEIDDILYIARANEAEELDPYISQVSQAHNNASKADILGSAVDSESGNTAIHYASANGHTDLLQRLLAYLPDTQQQPSQQAGARTATLPADHFLNRPNTLGNTALHYASLNGHLDSIKALIAHGADASILNKAGYDCVFEAERNGKTEVAEWLLREAIGLEKAVRGSVAGPSDAGERSSRMNGDDGDDEMDNEEDEEISFTARAGMVGDAEGLNVNVEQAVGDMSIEDEVERQGG